MAPHPLESAGPPVWNVARAAGLGLPRAPLGQAAEHLPALRAALAGVLVAAEGRDLVFIGRSPEPLRAYLSGLLRGVKVTWRVTGLNVSLLNATLTPAQATTLRPLLSSAGLNPRVLVREDRRAALVDVVASGGTFSALHRALRDWACEDARGPQCIERRVQVIGLLRSAGGRPRAWRWSAQPEFQGVQTRSVLIDWPCWQWLAEEGVKVAPHHPPACWVNTPAGLPERHPDRLEALGQARALYLLGQTRTERAAAAAELATAGGLRVAALRSLMAAWQSGAMAGRPERRGRLPGPWCG